MAERTAVCDDGRMSPLARLAPPALLTALALGPASTPAFAGPPKTSLLALGDFHGDEVKARSGEQWLGFFVEGAHSELALGTLRIDRVRDANTKKGVTLAARG